MGLKLLVASRIRQGRREKGWNQTEAGHRAGLSQQTWGSYETGEINIPLDTLERIAQILEKPIEFFVVADYEYTIKAVNPRAPSKKARSKRGAPKEPAR
jgi:transcriptional regulator with XRE-family HTH domain